METASFYAAVLFGCFTLLILGIAAIGIESPFALKFVALAAVSGYVTQVIEALTHQADLEAWPALDPIFYFAGLLAWGLAILFGTIALLSILFS